MAKKLRFPKKGLPSGLNKDGSEIVDSKPTELRASMEAPVTMRQKMRQLWEEFRVKEEEAQQQESISDAADFDVDNDEFCKSPYENEGSLSDAISQAPEEVEADASGANQQAQSEQPSAEGVQENEK